MRFVVDESLPASLTRDLNELGHESHHVYDLGLRSMPDDVVFKEAQALDATVISRDLDFANEVTFPPGQHAGLMIVRYPNSIAMESLKADLMGVVARLNEDDIKGNIVIIEPERIRIRRKTS